MSFSFGPNDIHNFFERKDADEVRSKGLSNIAEQLKSNLETGISSQEAHNDFAERIATYGVNYIEPPELTPIWKIFIGTFNDTTLIILMVSAVVSLFLGGITEGLGGMVEGIAILMAVLIVSTVTTFNDHQKEKQFRAQKETNAKQTTVTIIRGGVQKVVETRQVLVGDIVLFRPGTKLPADGLLIDGRNIKADESAFTGESEAVEKNQKSPFLLSGSEITGGTGRMLSIAVGENTGWGNILKKLNEEEPAETPLQTKLNEMAELIGKGGLGAAILTFLALMLFWIIDQFQNGFELSNMTEIVDFFIIGVTIVVVAVPEGLPLAVTISLAYSVDLMAKDNCLVKQLASCETMGGVNTICSDKTGTLTQNRMTVIKGLVAGVAFDSEASKKLNLPQSVDEIFNVGAAVNTDDTTRIEKTNSGPNFIGDKTEGAILHFLAEERGCDYDHIKKNYPRFTQNPFSSQLKRMSTTIRTDSGFRMFVKGAAEIVLSRCTSILTSDGEVIPLGLKQKQEVEDTIKQYADNALRAISFAFRDFEAREEEKVADNPPEDGLTFVGVVGILDPLRPEVRDAVRQCQRAGIMVRMVTGDNIATAKKIAKDCGILTDGIAMEGPDFDELTYDEMDDILPRLQVLARSSPTDKYNLVKRLMHNGDVVAVTGDGTNDAQALKKSDVGLAMGIQGTDVAKEAADIVILDDNFETIVKAAKWGRCIFDNIRKFLQFQLTVNVVALTVAFFGALTGKGTPLNAVQLLWVNLIMDTMAALALGTEKPTEDLLDRKPHGRTASLISPLMWRNIIGQSLFQCGLLFTVLYTGQYIFDVGQEGSISHYTVVFNLFVFMQVFNEFNARKVNEEFNVFHNIHTNYIFLGVIIVTVFVQILVVEIPGINTFVGCTHQTFYQWFVTILLSSLGLLIGVLVRLIPMPRQEEPKAIHEDIDDDQYTHQIVGLDDDE